jgi:membrane fusion protein (multidrug efflux system)
MDARVDISKQDGRMLADTERASATAQTHVFEQNDTAADAEVRKIIVANGGSAARLNKPAARGAAATIATLAAGSAAPRPVVK